MKIRHCRVCHAGIDNIINILDYKKVALAGSLLKRNQFKSEKKFPLKLVICKICKHLQIDFNPKRDLLFFKYRIR